MKEKGFTLIELLAVIVILAIIALIAVPIILNIINSAKDSANQRSVELYGKAIENSIAKAQLNEEIEAGKLSSSFLSAVEYNGNRVTCETNKLNPNGTVYLSGCKVEGDTKEYTYGKEQVEASTQVYKPQYYSWDLSGTVGTTNAPAEADRLTTPPAGKDYYLGYDVSNGKVSSAYLCFIRNDTEYCLKGADTEVHKKNVDVLKDAFGYVGNSYSDEETDFWYYYGDDGLDQQLGDYCGGCNIMDSAGWDDVYEGYFSCYVECDEEGDPKCEGW